MTQLSRRLQFYQARKSYRAWVFKKRYRQTAPHTAPGLLCPVMLKRHHSAESRWLGANHSELPNEVMHFSEPASKGTERGERASGPCSWPSSSCFHSTGCSHSQTSQVGDLPSWLGKSPIGLSLYLAHNCMPVNAIPRNSWECSFAPSHKGNQRHRALLWEPKTYPEINHISS